jgi:hypothetical protein
MMKLSQKQIPALTCPSAVETTSFVVGQQQGDGGEVGVHSCRETATSPRVRPRSRGLSHVPLESSVR